MPRGAAAPPADADDDVDAVVNAEAEIRILVPSYVPRVPIETLIPHPRNPNHGDVDEIEQSLRANGLFDAIKVEVGTNYMLAGNHTMQALGRCKVSAPPVIWLQSDDAAHALRIMIAANQTARRSVNDDERTRELLDELAQTPEGIGGTGYTAMDYELLQSTTIGGRGGPGGGAPLTKPDDAPPLPETPPISQYGDVFELGPHRLICGSSTEREIVERLLAGDTPSLVWTDPPYGVNYVGGTGMTMKNDNLGPEELEALLRLAFGNATQWCAAGAVWYVACPMGPMMLPFMHVLSDLGIWRQTLVWVKDRLVLGRSDFHPKHEGIIYGWFPSGEPEPLPAEYQEVDEAIAYGWQDGKHVRPPDRKQTTVLEFPKPQASRLHPTMKPVALVQRCVENSTRMGDVVLDLFGGSGTTLIACHGAGRVARLVELDPRYVDVICRRYQEHTGVVPVRDGEPVTFVVDEEAA